MRAAKHVAEMKRFIIAFFSLLGASPLAAQSPLYIVNGSPRDEIASMPPDDIERVEELPADEETIAQYGPQAANGVLLVTLRYDSPARFGADSLSFGSYIAGRVEWPDSEPAARVVLRYKVTAEGETLVTGVAESTDGRLKRRVLKAVAEAPRWEPARKEGRPVESEGVLRIQLPAGKRLPGELYIRMR